MTPDVENRFLGKIERDPVSGCWLWTDRLHHTGYATFHIERVTKQAHRVAYEHYVGPIPDGLEIDHLCRVKHCVNPRHLEPVTNLENVRRWAATITHCPRGHAYDAANTYVSPRGWRFCRICNRAAALRVHARKRRAL